MKFTEYARGKPKAAFQNIFFADFIKKRNIEYFFYSLLAHTVTDGAKLCKEVRKEARLMNASLRDEKKDARL